MGSNSRVMSIRLFGAGRHWPAGPPDTPSAVVPLMISLVTRTSAMPRDPDQEPYNVGYGRPPYHTRFKPGCSGNPRGRPKDAKNLSTLIHEALNEPVVVNENGRRRKLSKRQAVIKQLINRSAQG